MPARMKLFLSAIVAVLSVAGCSDTPQQQTQKPDLLIYCGITMVNPVKEIAALLEPQLGVHFVITQGGSEDLYQSLKAAGKGDIYLPGSASYREKHLAEGLLGDYKHVGYNQAALFVRKHNPLHLTDDLSQLADEKLKVVIGEPDSGSIGRETRRILQSAGIYDQVRQNSVYLATDSRNINYSLKSGDADISINWRATGFFNENSAEISVIDLSADIAKPKKLLMNLLVFSQYPEKARVLMDYAASAEGQAIFRKHGFLDNSMQAGGN